MVKTSYFCENHSFMSKTSLLTHIVFCTKHRADTIAVAHRDELYRYIWGIIKNKGCYLYRISGTTNHLHMLIDIHPSVAVSDLVKTIKSESSQWLKNNPNFPLFQGWGKEYFAGSVSYEGKDAVIDYIKSQMEHHGVTDFTSEMEAICVVHGLFMHKDDFC